MFDYWGGLPPIVQSVNTETGLYYRICKKVLFYTFFDHILCGLSFYTWFFAYYTVFDAYPGILLNYTFSAVFYSLFCLYALVFTVLYMFFVSFLAGFLCIVLYTAYTYNYTWDFF